MNISEAKQIDIVAYLAKLGYTPIKRQGINSWFLSPFRKEDKPSFKVNTQDNLWYDFGSAEGGDIIALGKCLYQTEDVSVILKKIAEVAPNANDLTREMVNKGSRQQIKSEMRNICIIDLSNEALLSYLMSRKIDLRIAMTYCREIHYDHFYNHYYGIAFENISGGYEIRNPYFKGCRGKKDISVIKADIDDEKIESCCLFEGFMDFLAYMTLNQHNQPTVKTDCIVLNSVSNIKKSVDTLAEYREIHCYLDNDNAGQLATQYLTAMLPDKVFDESFRYKRYKDVNDYLRSIKDYDQALREGTL